MKHLLLTHLALAFCSAIQTITTTLTQLEVKTVTESIVAIGGVIQNVKVYLDNGNGNTWDYSTRLVTGERVLTITTVTNTECATVFVYGDVTLTTETTLINGKAVSKNTAVVEDMGSWKQLHAKGANPHEIMDSFVRNAKALDAINPEPKNGNIVLAL